VIVNPPLFVTVMASEVIWASRHAPMPAHVRILTSSFGGRLEVHRPDAWTLLVRPRAGFLAWKVDRMVRAPSHALAVGAKVRLTGMTAEVMALTPDGWPAEVAFRFEAPLEDTRWRWLCWREGAFTPFTPPPVGGSVWFGKER
jgi:hypothetical protein